MFNAFSTALSALNADSLAIDVIGNNLANLNTTGYKATTVSFHDLVSQSGDSSDLTRGGGAGRPTTSRLFTQGSIQASGGPLDAAIQGNGFFVVRDSSGQQLYTRAGNFHLDLNGNLLTATGQRVQGWNASGTSAPNPNSPISDINIPVAAVRQPVSTGKMSLDVNLDAGAPKDTTFSTPIEVVDALGAKHILTATFTKTGTNTWGYALSIPGADLTSGKAGTPSEISGASGTLTFENGVLKSGGSGPAPDSPVSVSIAGLANGAPDLKISWSFFNSDGTSKLTQFAQASAASATSQDGVPPGQITGVSLSDGGAIVAHYSNGQDQFIAQLAVAAIRNPESLVAVGDNNLQADLDTAPPSIGTADSGGRGKVIGGALESSTVDIAREFTNLIVMQRSYQANARVITATDELSQDTINLKR